MKAMRAVLLVASCLLTFTHAGPTKTGRKYTEHCSTASTKEPTERYGENWTIFAIAISLAVVTVVAAAVLKFMKCFSDAPENDDPDEMAVDIDDGAWCSACMPCQCCQKNGFCEFYSLSVAVISLGLLGFAVGSLVNMAFDSCVDPGEEIVPLTDLTNAENLPAFVEENAKTRTLTESVAAAGVDWVNKPIPLSDTDVEFQVTYNGETRTATAITDGGKMITLKQKNSEQKYQACGGDACVVTWEGAQYKYNDGIKIVTVTEARSRTVEEIYADSVKLRAETYCTRSKADWMKLITLPGKLWVNALKLFVSPLVVFMFLLMPFRVDSYAQKGYRTVILLSVTSFCAALQGLMWVNLLAPGYYINLRKPKELQTAEDVAFYNTDCKALYPADDEVTVELVSKAKTAVAGAGSLSELDSILGIFEKAIVKDIVKAISGIEILAVICFFCGLGIFLKKQAARQESKVWMDSTVNCSKGIMKAILGLVVVVIQFTPIGMFSLVASKLAAIDNGTYQSVLSGIGMYVVTQTIGQLVHMFVFYPIFGFLVTMGKDNGGFFGGWKYFYQVFQAPLTAFATSSSAATMPVTLAVCKDKDRGNISGQSADFTIPLGAAINMDGTGLGFPVMVVFVAQAYNQDLGFGQMLLVAIIAVVCSIGTAPIPNAGIVYITMLMAATNDPLLSHDEVIGTGMTLILIMDWFVDRVETAQNVWSDCNIARIIDIWQRDGTPACVACLPGCGADFLAGDLAGDEETPKETRPEEREMSQPVKIDDGTEA